MYFGIRVYAESSLIYPSGSYFSSRAGYNGGYAYINSGETNISNKLLLSNAICLGGSTGNAFYVYFLARKTSSGIIRIEGQMSSDGLSRYGVGIDADSKLTVRVAASVVTSIGSYIDNSKTYLVVARWDYVNNQADLKMILFEEGDNIPVVVKDNIIAAYSIGADSVTIPSGNYR